MPPCSILDPRTKDRLSTEWGVYHSSRAGYDVALFSPKRESPGGIRVYFIVGSRNQERERERSGGRNHEFMCAYGEEGAPT